MWRISYFSIVSLSILISFATMLQDQDESSEVCMKSGKPKVDEYKCQGREINISPDLKAYQVGEGNKKGVIVIYDIFGFHIPQTRRFADTLSNGSFNVIMPDFFRENPWSLENFPPKNSTEFSNWMNKFGSFDIVKKDLVLAIRQLQQTGAEGKPGILGFCWGGKMTMYASQSKDFSCGISIHGAGITEALAQDVNVPMMFLPSGEDPSLDSVENILNEKPFGKDCVYYRFDKMVHGFAAARGDWNNENTRKDILTAVYMSKDFLRKHVQ